MKERIKNSILNISYSRLFDMPEPWNTIEMYKAAAKAGFDGIKGDVTPTLDGKLIMCHDSFFNFDENGRVLEPGEEGVSTKNINELTYEECKKLEYARESAKEHLGYYAKVAGLEDLISVCKETGKFPYITVRDAQIELCVDEVYRLLEKYDMTKNCIINSFSYETLKMMRKKDPDIVLSYVFGPELPLTKELVEGAAELGNCVVCMFMRKETQLAGEILKQSWEAMGLAKEKGVLLYLAHAIDRESYKLGVKNGFRGFQCLMSDVLR